MSIIILDSLIYIFLISYILSCLNAKDLNFPLILGPDVPPIHFLIPQRRSKASSRGIPIPG